ncbi:hypothetical protein O6H91_15G076600 [Diphasiastrum complanatum]|uniref:Uncharacterized protein n=1 Tax=Diphasiastrum complanatum TaxID=34168 RepID=A0ACC2BJW5_DIPCM|nr:hypothetical protein O6H91_15G076600 [Diphasiastrum complanatum]
MSQPRVRTTVGRGGQEVARQAVLSREMYSDRIGASSNNRKRSIKDRLGGNVDRLMGQGRPGVKRPRQEDTKWMHDMFEDEHGDSSPSSNRQNGSQDLRLKLSRKNRSKDIQGGIVAKVSNGETVKDIREKAPLAPRVEHEEEHPRVASVVRGSTGPPLAATRPAGVRSNPSTQGKRLAVEEPTVATLLQSLGLSKYLLSFQAEEVDMAALRHMNDDDLKELGVPMGPRKKILLALAARS